MFNHDDEYYADRASEALELPSNALFTDDDLYATHTLMFATPDIALTDEYAIDYSNYRSILRDYGGENVEAATVGHWTYSRFVCLKVRVLDDNGQVTDTFKELVDIAEGLQNDYPIYDESDYQELEDESRHEWLTEWAREQELPLNAVYQAIYDNSLEVDGSPGDWSFYVDGSWRLSWDERNEKARSIVLDALRGMITLGDHANGTEMHYPEYCFACERTAL